MGGGVVERCQGEEDSGRACQWDLAADIPEVERGALGRIEGEGDEGIEIFGAGDFAFDDELLIVDFQCDLFEILVLRRIEDVPHQIAEVGLGDVFQAFGHDGDFFRPHLLDVFAGDDFFLGSLREQLHVIVGVFDEPAGDQAIVLSLNDGVFVTFADDLIGVDDVGEKRIEGRAADAGEIGADGGAFVVEGVANEAGFGGEGVAGVEVDGAVEDDLFFGGDELGFFGGSFAEGTDGFGEQGEEVFVSLARDGANGGERDVGGGDGFSLVAFEQFAGPLNAGGHDFGNRAAGVGGEILPILYDLVGGFVAAQFVECADQLEFQCF